MPAPTAVRAARGVRDILPAERAGWRRVEEAAHRLARRHGCEEIETPIIERAQLIERGVGDETDVGGKELYRLQSAAESSAALVLRPEATAGVVRAYHEGNLAANGLPQRLYFLGSMFRHDRPQAGRLRQFHQFNVEVLGEGSAEIDADLVELGWGWLQELGVEAVSLRVNSIGDASCRPDYLKRLRDYYGPLRHLLHDDCQRRLEVNPLRLFDCKEEQCQPFMAEAPKISDHLCEDCRESAQQVRRLLEAAHIPYVWDPLLVRGLDYYTRTVFEYQSALLGGAQNSLGGGGRYDRLSEALGYGATPGSGFAMGLERVLLCLPKVAPPPAVQVLVVTEPGCDAADAARLTRLLRERVPAAMDSSSRSLKAKMRSAAKARAAHVAILSAEEARRQTVRVRNMETGSQAEMAWARALEVLA